MALRSTFSISNNYNVSVLVIVNVKTRNCGQSWECTQQVRAVNNLPRYWPIESWVVPVWAAGAEAAQKSSAARSPSTTHSPFGFWGLLIKAEH